MTAARSVTNSYSSEIDPEFDHLPDGTRLSYNILADQCPNPPESNLLLPNTGLNTGWGYFKDMETFVAEPEFSKVFEVALRGFQLVRPKHWPKYGCTFFTADRKLADAAATNLEGETSEEEDLDRIGDWAAFAIATPLEISFDYGQ